MDDVKRIAARLTKDERRAVLAPMRKFWRAGDLCPFSSHSAAQTWLKKTPLFERYFHGGNLAYRLTPLGQSVRQYLMEQDNGD